MNANQDRKFLFDKVVWQEIRMVLPSGPPRPARVQCEVGPATPEGQRIILTVGDTLVILSAADWRSLVDAVNAVLRG